MRKYNSKYKVYWLIADEADIEDHLFATLDELKAYCKTPEGQYNATIVVERHEKVILYNQVMP